MFTEPVLAVLDVRTRFIRAGVGEGTGMAVGAAREQQVGKAVSRLRGPGILLGIGLGGFVDGILFHQILQWHHLLSSRSDDPTDTVAGLETNTLADGLFHAFTSVVAVVGVWLLWRRTTESRGAASGRALVGWTLVGWGLFNLVEGVIDHEILGLHHVREGAGHQTAYDVAFLAFAGLLVLGGWLLARSDRHLPPARS